MEHSEAVESMAAERYLLGEMTSDERDSFEEHYFDCAACARDVREGAALLGSGRELVRQERPTGPLSIPKARFPWWTIAAGLVLLAIVGYQNGVQIPQLRTQNQAALLPAVLHPQSFLSAGTRGAGELEIETGASQPLVLSVDIPPDAGAVRYRCDVRDAAGRTHASFDVTAEEARDNVLLSLPAGDVAAGSYKLAISAVHADGSVVSLATYPFVIRVR